ncbi:MAG: sensor histidine kinase [Nocardioides sp.]
MSVLSIPPGVANWRVSAVVTAAVAFIFALLGGRLTHALAWPEAMTTVSLVLGCALLSSGLLFYTHWRLARWTATGWLLVGSLAIGAHLTVTAAASLLPGGTAATQPWETASLVALMCTLAVVAERDSHRGSPADPGVIGIGAGACFAGLGQLGALMAPMPSPGTFGIALVLVVTLAGSALLAVVVWRQLAAPPWVRHHITTALLLIGSQQAAAWSDNRIATPIALAFGAAAAALVLDTAVLLVLASIVDHRRALDTMRNSLEDLENGVRAERETLHEIRATVSGIGQATRLIRSPGLAPERRDALLHMIDAEAHRLERLGAGRECRTPQPVDLDRVLETIVLRQRVRGQEVQWQPSGHRVVAREDDVAEILSILLENSHRHAPECTALVEVRYGLGHQINLTVSDTGRGVPVRLRSGIFEWGVRNPRSPGQGIGLAVARRLARELGGDIELDKHGWGATFRLTLPAAESEVRVGIEGEPHGVRSA